MKKKVSIVGTVGLPPIYGGFETLADNLSARHESKWVDFFDLSVYCSSFSYREKENKFRSTQLRYVACKANGIYSVIYDTISMLDAVLKKDNVILVLGVSGCLFLPLVRFFSNAKIVVNIDGLEWRREKWGWFARAFLKLSEKIAVKFSDVVISDNQAVADYVENNYSIRSENVAYGGDHVNSASTVSAPFVLPERYFFTVCRIEPENNISLILGAFAKSPQANLVIVGNWKSSEYGRALRADFSKFKNICICDPIYNIDILQCLRRGSIGYVHGHSAGGTNPSLVEAMSTGLSVFAFDCDFNRYTTDGESFFFKNSADLMFLLKNVDDSDLLRCSQKMFEIANVRYRWDLIADKYFSLF